MARKTSWTQVFEKVIIRISERLHVPDVILKVQKKKNYILMYHSVTNESTGYHYEVSVENFRRQLKYLNRKFDIVPLEKIYTNGSRHGRRVALTFDDAYEDFYQNVYPLLLEFQLPAALFVPTACIRNGNDQATAEKYLSLKRHLSWEQVREMMASGLVQIGSHTHSHEDLRCTPAIFEEDVCRSIQLIEEKTGQKPKFFAYPFGVHSDETDTIIKRLGFQFAVMSKSQYVKGKYVEGRVDIYRRNELLPYFKLTLAGIITSNTKDIYRHVKAKIPHRRTAVQHSYR